MKKRRFYAVAQCHPDKDNYGMAQGVFRDIAVTPERFDRPSGKWVDDPELLRELASGGDFFGVTEAFMDSVLAAWRDGTPVPKIPGYKW